VCSGAFKPLNRFQRHALPTHSMFVFSSSPHPFLLTITLFYQYLLVNLSPPYSFCILQLSPSALPYLIQINNIICNHILPWQFFPTNCKTELFIIFKIVVHQHHGCDQPSINTCYVYTFHTRRCSIYFFRYHF